MVVAAGKDLSPVQSRIEMMSARLRGGVLRLDAVDAGDDGAEVADEVLVGPRHLSPHRPHGRGWCDLERAQARAQYIAAWPACSSSVAPGLDCRRARPLQVWRGVFWLGAAAGSSSYLSASAAQKSTFWPGLSTGRAGQAQSFRWRRIGAPHLGPCPMKYASIALAFLLGFALLLYAEPWS
jgi:hypothetical protein